MRKQLQERYGSESSLRNLVNGGDGDCGKIADNGDNGYDSAEDSLSSNGGGGGSSNGSGSGTANSSNVIRYTQGIKQLSYLISTMNQVFPDYEFSHVRPDLFIKVGSIECLKGDVYTMLWNSGSISKSTEIFTEFINQLWSAVDCAIGGLEDCEIWSFMPSDNDDNIEDPFRERGTIWSFNYFIWNRKEKRLILFYCRCISAMEGEDSFLADGISFQPRSLTPLN